MADKKPVGNPNIHKYGKKFSSTYQPKKKGRPPANLRKYIKGVDVSREDMQDLFAMIAVKCKTIDEVRAIVNDKEAHPIIRIYGKAILSDMVKNKTDTLERVLDRGFGKAGEHTTNKNTNINTFEEQAASMSPEERQAVLDEYNAQVIASYERRSKGEDQGKDKGSNGEVLQSTQE